jgi:hypothetical protein
LDEDRLIQLCKVRAAEKREEPWRDYIKVASPFDPSNRVAIENALGFNLPDLLIRLFAEVGNGGFGPGYGLLGLGSGGFAGSDGRTADANYLWLRRDGAAPYRTPWPRWLFPICDFGCAIWDVIDIRTGQMLISDGNHWDHRSTLKASIFVTNVNFKDWLTTWALGGSVHETFSDGRSGWRLKTLQEVSPAPKRGTRRDPRQGQLL